jgi:hypothetical protein
METIASLLSTIEGESEFIHSPSNIHDLIINPARTSAGANRPKPEIPRRRGV